MIFIASIPDKIQWHPGFCGAIELEFHTDSSSLLYVPELSLGKKPLSADLLILKKTAEFPLENETGKLFKSYNIIEYKSPDDSLTIDDFFKVSAYACLYKSSGNTVNKYPEQEITVSIFRDAFPRNLFSMLKNSGRTIEKKYPGVYYIKGKVLFDTQIVVMRQLDPKTHYAFRVLSKNARPDDVKHFLTQASSFIKPSDKNNADAVLQVSIAANRTLYDEIRRESDMCQAMEELMKDVIEARVEEKTKLRVEQEMKQITQQVTEQVTQQVTEQVTQQVTEQVTQQVTEQVTQQVTEQVTQQVTEQVNRNAAIRMHEKGMSLDTIAELIDHSVDIVRQWLSPAAV